MNDPQSQSDKQLLALLKQSDRQAYTFIYQKFWQSLFNSAYKRLKNKEQCQDIVQTVLSDLWRRREQVVIDDLPAYLHTAIRFQVFKQISRKPSQYEFLDDFDNLISSPVRTDDDLLEKEIMNLVKLWVEALPAKRRAIFLMYTQEELSTREIADRLGITQKTVQNQLNTSISMLRTRLSQVLSIYIISSII